MKDKTKKVGGGAKLLHKACVFLISLAIVFGAYLLYTWYGGIDRFILTYTDGEFLRDYVFNTSPYKLVNTFAKMSDEDIDKLLEKDTNLRYPYDMYGYSPETGEVFQIYSPYETQYDWVVSEFEPTEYDNVLDEGLNKLQNFLVGTARADENTWYNNGWFNFIVGTSDGKESKIRVMNIYGSNSRLWTVTFQAYILAGWGYNNHNITVVPSRDIPPQSGKLDFVGGTLWHGATNVCVPFTFEADIPANDYFAYWSGNAFNGYCQAAPTNEDASGPRRLTTTPDENGNVRWTWRAIVSYANSGHQSEGRGLIYITMGYYFEPAKSELYIDTQGGTLGSQSGKFLYTTKEVLETLDINDIEKPQRSGYKFLGWELQNGSNSTGSLSGTTFTFSGYTGGTKLKTSYADQSYGRYEQSYLPQSTLVAQWQRVTYTVEIYADQPDEATHTVQRLNPSGWNWDNSKKCYTRTFNYDDTTLGKTSDFYSLVGWTILDSYYISSNGPDASKGTFSSGQSNLTDVDGSTIKLYVYWKQNTYTIHYDKNDTTYNIYGDRVTSTATGNTSNSNATYDANITLSKNGFNKIGYTFKEWNTKSDGSGSSYSSGQTLNKPNFTSTNNGSITLYAIWEPITYLVRLHPNTPADATHSVTNKADSSWTWKDSYYEKQFRYDNTTLPNITAVYTLTGWNNNTNWYSNPGNNGEASGTQYSPGQKNLTTTNNATINLYPFWNKNTYYISYDGNNTTYNIYGDKVTTSYTGTTSNTTHKYDSTVVLANNGFSKKGYLFKEWNTKFDGSGTGYSAGQTLSKPNFTPVNGGTFTLYAIWEPIRYSIRFNSNDTNILDYNDTDSYYQEVTGSDGKSTNDIRYDQPITLNDITFERTKDITLSDGSVIKGGFDFIGWGNANNQKSASFNNKWSGINFRDVTVNNTTFDIYALWERPVAIKFNLQGGKYKDREYPSGIVLKATVYNDRYDYTFNILDGLSSQSSNSTAQTGKIHAYGTYDADGINSIYSLRNADGTPERFVGWSTSTSIGDLLEDYMVYNPSRLGTINTLNKATNTYERINNLYACWEQVLRLEVSVERTLGSIDYEDGTNHNLGAQNITSANSTDGVTLRTIVRPGEQGEYNIKASGTTEDSSVIIKFEDTVTDIYNNGDSSSTWHDDLNPVSDNPLEENQKHGLDRKYNGEFTTIRNKWYTPNYFGTDKSYETSRDKTEYSFDIKVSQPSIYYDYVYGTDETIDVKVIIDVSTGGTGNNGSVSDGGDTTLDELRTRLKIRILD